MNRWRPGRVFLVLVLASALLLVLQLPIPTRSSTQQAQVTGVVAPAGLDTGAIERALGLTGELLSEGVFRIPLLRTDLVFVRGVSVQPSLVGGSVAFKQEGEQAVVAGELALLENEVGPVMLRLLQNDFAISAVHDHLFAELPALQYVHFTAAGDAAAVAAALRQALDAGNVPLARPPARVVTAAPSATATPTATATATRTNTPPPTATGVPTATESATPLPSPTASHTTAPSHTPASTQSPTLVPTEVQPTAGPSTTLPAPTAMALPWGNLNLFANPLLQATPAAGLDTSTILDVLGRAGRILSDGVLLVEVPRTESISVAGIVFPPAMGVESELYFQAANAQTAASGHLVLTADEVIPVTHTLREGGFEVMALVNEWLTEQPRLFYLYYWATGNAADLSAVLQAALAQTNSSGEG